jgi:MtrB/PioB family decaheme-associated outer membrane protein
MTRHPTARRAGSLLALILVAAWSAHAGETSPEWRELVTPLSTLELGLGFGHDTTPIFGNATGIASDAAYVIGNLDLRSAIPDLGQATPRWRLLGRQLGLETRELGGIYSQPGLYRLSFGLDQLNLAAAENYQTPFLGVGTAALSLPAGLVQASSNPLTGAARLTENMHPAAIGTTRRRANFGGHLRLSPEWEWRAAFSEEKLSGTRATGATMGSGGGSIALILPEPIDTVTRRIETSVGFQQPGRHLQLSYRGSFFSNDIDGYSFQNPFTISNTLRDNRMGSAPDNEAHQFSLNGAYSFGPKARLTGNAVYGRLTQNEAFLPYSTAPGSPALPAASLDGEVITRQLNLKLTSRPLADLRLNAQIKADDRDNRTPSREYLLPGASSARLGEVGGANVRLSNTPFSRRTRLAQVEAGYAMRVVGDLTLTGQREEIARYCHDDPNCAEVPETRENNWRLEWRRDLLSGVSGWLGLSQAQRRGDDYQRYAGSVELAGMRKFFLADRQRSQLRAGVHAEISDALSLGVQLEGNRDHYDRSPYGLQSARNHALNIDLGYAVSEDLSLALFASRESYRSRLANSYVTSLAAPGVGAETAGAAWQAELDDNVDTLGVSLKHKGLRSGRLELSADLVLIQAHSPYRIDGGPYSATSTPTVLLPGALPEYASRAVELRLGARYALADTAALRLAYLYRRLASDDFSLDLYSTATLARLLGTEENSPRHAAHLLGVSYERGFR